MTKHPHRPSKQIISSFEARAMRKRTWGQKLADSLTSFFGSPTFLILNIIIFISWIAINQGLIPGFPRFDPYPYVLLITVVSLEAIILTTIVLMSQNRQSQTGTLRDELQLQVELITEKEISKALRMLKTIAEKQGIKLNDKELTEMIENIDRSYIERKLQEQIEGKK